MIEMLYLIDTSVWIPALRSKSDRSMVERLADIIDKEKSAVCAMIILELLSGVKSASQYDDLLFDLSALNQITIDDAVWECSYDLGFRLRKAGLTVPSPDIIIASAAIVHDCVLLHRDRHFELISKHSELKTEKL